MPALKPTQSSLRRARLIAALAVSQIIGWGTSWDMTGVLVGTSIGRDLQLQNALVFAGLSVMMVTGGLAGPWIGRMLERHGAAHVLSAGSVLMTAGLLLLAAAQGAVVYALSWLVIGLAGACCLSVPAYAAVVEREGAGGKRVIALLMIFTGLSASIFWPIETWMAQAVGWRVMLVILASLNFLICLPLHLFALPKRVAQPDGTPAQADDVAPLVLTPAQKRLAFALIALPTAITSFVSFGLSPTFLHFLTTAGATPALAVQLGAARGVIGISARALDFALGKRSTPLTAALIGAGMMVISYPLLLVSPAPVASLIAFTLLYSFGSGVLSVARAVLPLAIFSPKEFGLQSARISLPTNLAVSVAPVFFTALMDNFGTASALYVAGVLSLVCIVLLLMLGALARSAARPVTITP
ncbi:MFS transporter [Rhizobium oryzicola]